MSGGNVTIGQFATTSINPVNGDSFAAYQSLASTTVRFLASQVFAGFQAQTFALTGQTTSTTVGIAGVAAALPSTPYGYLVGTINGVAVKLPFYIP